MINYRICTGADDNDFNAERHLIGVLPPVFLSIRVHGRRHNPHHEEAGEGAGDAHPTPTVGHEPTSGADHCEHDHNGLPFYSFSPVVDGSLAGHHHRALAEEAQQEEGEEQHGCVSRDREHKAGGAQADLDEGCTVIPPHPRCVLRCIYIYE